jgi:hypothetical protein
LFSSLARHVGQPVKLSEVAKAAMDGGGRTDRARDDRWLAVLSGDERFRLE